MERPRALHRRDLVQDEHDQGRQAHRVRQHHQRPQRHLRSPHLDAERRQDRLRHLRGRAADADHERQLQRQPVAPRRRHAGPFRHAALRRRRPGGKQRADQCRRLSRVLAHRRRPRVVRHEQLLLRPARGGRRLPDGPQRGRGARALRRGRADGAQPAAGRGVRRREGSPRDQRRRFGLLRSRRASRVLRVDLRGRRDGDRGFRVAHLHEPRHLPGLVDGQGPGGSLEHQDAVGDRRRERGTGGGLRGHGDRPLGGLRRLGLDGCRW